ncbi:hypothetical protein I6N95_00710 [Vagococcus sp. BWB3-3]|uniref:Uncharacterized protein n=1 Tax=Vagococcus allomyrinae TaxID=2794353 RepID=A0A940P9W1_9ENTE|nr:hypothetical protein [Vagococcus allomyrinae]MBP1039516.1 hypothetical protein [Vagococcus allomyrinae]
MKQLTIGESFSGFLSSLKIRNMGNMTHKEIYEYIFEDFLSDVVAYLGPYTLDRLVNEGIIDGNIYDISKSINDEIFDMINGAEWNVCSVKKSKRWNKIFDDLSKLDNLIHEKWTDEEIEYLKTM